MPTRAKRLKSKLARKSAARRGYDRKWQRASKAFLRLHPLCVHCLAKGKTAAAEVVDHKQPHRGNMRLFWMVENWQALCKLCHDAKTRRGA